MSAQRIPPDAFDYYFANRSYRAVAEKYGVSKRAVTKAAQRENWQARLERVEEQARESAERKTLERFGNRRLVNRAAQRLFVLGDLISIRVGITTE